MQALIQICNVFAYDALLYKRQSYRTTMQMSSFLTAMKGHVDTDAFINCEIQRFDTSYFQGLSTLLAFCFLSEGYAFLHSTAVSVCPIQFMRGLWKCVLSRVGSDMIFSKDLMSSIHTTVSLFVYTEFCRFCQSRMVCV
jgi:hypothetical protein